MVERRDLALSVAVTGELEAIDTADLGPPPVDGVWDFTIASLVPEGSAVEAGAAVMSFDTSMLQQQLQEAIAEHDTAAGTLDKRKTDLRAEREQEILALAEAEARLRRSSMKAEVDAAVLARRELELAGIDRDLARAEVQYRAGRLESLSRRSESELGSLGVQTERARQRVAELRAKTAAMTVVAPRAGHVVYKTDWSGAKKKVGDTVWRLEVVAQIPDLDTLRARAEVDEAQSGRVEPGQPVTFRLDAHPDHLYSGTVASVNRTVRPRSFRTPRNVVDLLVTLDRTDPERMRPGMRLQGTVEVERRSAVVAAPLAALAFDETGPFVRIRGDGDRKHRPSLGARDATWVEILDGLESGDRLEAVSAGES